MVQGLKHVPIVEKSFVLCDLFGGRSSDLLEVIVRRWKRQNGTARCQNQTIRVELRLNK